jgi:biotin-dependent carboxylase-like uncharacterized protein
MSRQVTVLATGPLALVEDLGRPGFAHVGVPPSGALDQPALRLANRLVGNAEDVAGLELLLGGLRLRTDCSCTVAVTGPATALTVNGAAADSHTPVHLTAGDTMSVAGPESGLRNYLAVSGGIDVRAELGSRSTDQLSGLGPRPLRPGDVLPLGPMTGWPNGFDVVPPSRIDRSLVLPMLLGPRDDWFAAAARQLTEHSWRVSPESNRVGLRLAGPALRRDREYRDAELPSEAVITGAVQVPANGRPLVFLADHPTTGGYPVIGVVPVDQLPALAQARPGTTIRFRPS